MTTPSSFSAPEKLGLFLPEGGHARMVDAAARLGRKSPRGTVRFVYERALSQLVDDLVAGDDVPFPAMRGAKDRVSVRISARLATRLRHQMVSRNLKLTDFASVAIDRFLTQDQGARHGATVPYNPGHPAPGNRGKGHRREAAAERPIGG